MAPDKKRIRQLVVHKCKDNSYHFQFFVDKRGWETSRRIIRQLLRRGWRSELLAIIQDNHAPFLEKKMEYFDKDNRMKLIMTGCGPEQRTIEEPVPKPIMCEHNRLLARVHHRLYIQPKLSNHVIMQYTDSPPTWHRRDRQWTGRIECFSLELHLISRWTTPQISAHSFAHFIQLAGKLEGVFLKDMKRSVCCFLLQRIWVREREMPVNYLSTSIKHSQWK